MKYLLLIKDSNNQFSISGGIYLTDIHNYDFAATKFSLVANNYIVNAIGTYDGKFVEISEELLANYYLTDKAFYLDSSDVLHVRNKHTLYNSSTEEWVPDELTLATNAQEFYKNQASANFDKYVGYTNNYYWLAYSSAQQTELMAYLNSLQAIINGSSTDYESIDNIPSFLEN
jgi:hypothetical protein